jgi:alkaline phosphatase D
MKPEQAEKVLAANPHFIYAETRYRGYGVADISAQKMTTTLKAMQDATMPDSPAFDLAKFEVQAGSNRIDKL